MLIFYCFIFAATKKQNKNKTTTILVDICTEANKGTQNAWTPIKHFLVVLKCNCYTRVLNGFTRYDNHFIILKR
jgi:hypothetical protein